MAVKINRVDLVTHTRIKKTPLFKKQETPVEKINFDGTNIMQNSHLNFFDKLLFKTLDAITPIIEKHNTLKNNIIKISEKVLKNSNDI